MARPTYITLLAFTLALAAAWPAHAQSILKRFDIGSGLNDVGMVDASEDTEVQVPQGIYVDDDGQVYLLDQVNNRVLRFDVKNPDAPTRSLRLPEELRESSVTDLVVRGGDIYVWDGEIHALRPAGSQDAPTRGLEEYQTRGTEDELIVSAFAQMGSQKPSSDTDVLEDNTRSIPRARPPLKQSVASRGKGPVVATLTPEKSAASMRIEVQPRGKTDKLANFRVRVPDRLGAVEFLDIDNEGRMFVLAENVPETGDPAAAFVARYSEKGRLEGIYELPLSQSIGLSRRFVAVSPDGDVYFLKSNKRSVDVIGVGFRNTRREVIDVRPGYVIDPNELARQGRGGPLAAVRPLTRQNVVDTAFAFESIRWTVTPTAYGRDPDTACTGFRRVRRPGYMHGKLGQQVKGIPYCWGCMGSLSQIVYRIGRGMLAGNVCTRNEPRRDVVGVDCSAFVSATWGLASHFTTRAIPAITRPLSNAWSMLPGDAFNKPGSHVMLFVRFTADRKAEVIESSPGSCGGRVCRNVYPLAALLARGYTAVRYRALVNDATARVVTPEEREAQRQKAEREARKQKAEREHEAQKAKAKTKGKTKSKANAKPKEKAKAKSQKRRSKRHKRR